MSYEQFESAVVRPYFSGSYCPPGSPTRGQASIAEAAMATWPDMVEDELSELQDRLRHQLEQGGFAYVVVAQRSVPTMEQPFAI